MAAAANKSHTAAHSAKPKHSVMCAWSNLLPAVSALSLQAGRSITGYAADIGCLMPASVIVHEPDLTYSACHAAL